MTNWRCRILAVLFLLPFQALGSSHMDAPLISLDDPANTTDVYAFVSMQDGQKYLTTALSVYPFEEPGIGPNNYRFDDNVRYVIHVALGADIAAGVPTFSYEFAFTTTFKNRNTILQVFTGVVERVDDKNQNLVQRYTVTKLDFKRDSRTVLGTGVVPPNNQGNATPLYNQGNDGERPAKGGVSSIEALDPYTRAGVIGLGNYRTFAGQRDDAFYADVQAIFDLLKLRPKGQAQDSQGGFNVHTIVLQIPISEIGGDQQLAGVYATTLRPTVTVLSKAGPKAQGKFIQVARQGNPLFNEALVAIADKDRYNTLSPAHDQELFKKYAEKPELARLLNLLVFEPDIPGIETNRSDIVAIFIPDLIKVDLTTGPARLAGSGPTSTENPDDAGFSRLSVFGNDVLTSKIQRGIDGRGTIPGGWPNGRRFGDDVVDIAVTALISDLRTTPPTVRGPAGDNVDQNDIGYNKVMPYAATPQNGRNHQHHRSVDGTGTRQRKRVSRVDTAESPGPIVAAACSASEVVRHMSTSGASLRYH